MIVVFGSNVMDIFFEQADLPPKDTALFIDHHRQAIGGKGANQAVAAKKAGSDVRFFGALGSGAHGRYMAEHLEKAGLDISGIERLADTHSGIATIFVDESDGTHRILVSQGANLKAKQDRIADDILTSGNTVLVQGELPMAETEALVVRAKKNGARTVLNFAPATKTLSAELLNNLDYLIVNEHEATLVGKQINLPTEDKIALAAELNAIYGVDVVVTLGPDGCVAATKEGLVKVSTLKIKAVDTVGAGDAHAGFFTAALDQGLSLEDALKHASVAGALACTSFGAQTAIPSKEDVLKACPQIDVVYVANNRGQVHRQQLGM